jgi:hypothetical protein
LRSKIETTDDRAGSADERDCDVFLLSDHSPTPATKEAPWLPPTETWKRNLTR